MIELCLEIQVISDLDTKRSNHSVLFSRQKIAVSLDCFNLLENFGFEFYERAVMFPGYYERFGLHVVFFFVVGK